MKSRTTASENLITAIVKGTGYSAVIFVVVIFIFLLSQGLPTLREVPLSNLFSTRWYPIEGYYGILPLLLGSLIVTLARL